MENIFEITIDFQNRSMPNIKYKQGDTDGSILKINLVGNGTPIDITGQDIEFNFLKPDNTIVIQNDTNGVSVTDAVKGQFQCILKNQTLAAVGEVQFEVSFKKDGKTLSTPTFKFVVEKSIGNGDSILSTNYISTIDNILLVISTAEGIRNVNENTRSAAENTRATNEGIRIINEASRLSVEGSRVTAETTRVIAETTRGTNETARGTAETSRATAETNRNTAEIARATAENIRKTQETARVTSETDRTTRFNALTTAQQQAAEVVNARTSTNKAKTFAVLNDRLEALEADEITVVLDAQANTIRESIPSGFTALSDMDYTYMSTNPNTIKMLTDSSAFVNGYKTVIPAGTVITLNVPPVDVPRDDLIFLECWKALATNGSVTWNYRIRVVDGVDFSTYIVDGFTKNIQSVSNIDLNIFPQGNNTMPIVGANNDKFIPMSKTSINAYSVGSFSEDTGLYVSGRGDIPSKTLLKTLDGYCYAIPMFKIHRRPSCGYMETNEYLKISPLSTVLLASGKTSQARIAHTGITGGVTTTISGKTLVNLLGDAGNCEDASKWVGNPATDASIKLFGNSSFKFIGIGNSPSFYKDLTPLDSTHKYLVSGHLYISTYTSGTLSLSSCDYGTWGGTGSTVNFDTTKINQWQRKSSILTGKSGARFYFAGSTATFTSYADGIMIYDLTDIYGAGNEPSDIAQLERELPFVNGVGHAQPSALKVTGKNRLNPFGGHIYPSFINSNGSITIPPDLNSAWYLVYKPIGVKPNTSYTISTTSPMAYGRFALKGGKGIDEDLIDSSILNRIVSSRTFNTDNRSVIYLGFCGDLDRTYVSNSATFNIQLEEGNTLTAYEPYMESIVNLPEECSDLKAIKTVKDSLDLSSGILTRNISDWINLDGSFSWGSANIRSGYKQFYSSIIYPLNNLIINLIKYNGVQLDGTSYVLSECGAITSDGRLYVNALSSDTGFTDIYSPTNPEIKSYFYGYKMCHSDGVSPYQVSEVPYNPTTWAEWQLGGATADSTGIEITGNGGTPYGIINTNIKVSTKYGVLYNVISSNLIMSLSMGSTTRSFDAIVIPKTIGNQKVIATSKSAITTNSISIWLDGSETVGNKIKLKDIRLFELPTGSQIETDFNTLTADQLATKYLFYGLNPKNWKKVTDGTGITATLPTGSYSGYTPYKMIYQLATPVVTNIKEKIQGRNYYNVGYNGVEVKQVSSQMGMPIAVPNLVTNGDFSNGTTGWSSTLSTTSVSNNIASNTGNGSGNMPSLNSPTITVTTGKKYARALISVTNSICTQIRLRCSGGYLDVFQTNPIANKVYTLSGIATVPTDQSATLVSITHYYSDSASANGQVMQIQQVYVVDLTATFGAGNEPDQAWCDKYLAFGTNFKMVSPANTTALAISNDYGSRFEGVKGNVGVIPANKYSAYKTYKLHYQKEDGSYVPPEVLVTIPVNVNINNLMSKYNSVIQSDLDTYDLNNDGIIDIYDMTIASQGSTGTQLTKNATIGNITLSKALIPYKKNSDGALGITTKVVNFGTLNINSGETKDIIVSQAIYDSVKVGEIYVNPTLPATFNITIIDKLGSNTLRLRHGGNASITTFISNRVDRQDKLFADIIADRDLYNLRHQVSLSGFNYQSILEESFDKLLRNEL